MKTWVKADLAPDYLTTWIPGYLDTWLLGYLNTSQPGYLVTWVLPVWGGRAEKSSGSGQPGSGNALGIW